MDTTMATKRLLNEQSQTIEQLKGLIEQLKLQHEKKEGELIKHIGILYHDLQQNKKKTAHLMLKHQQVKKVSVTRQLLRLLPIDFSVERLEQNLQRSLDSNRFTVHLRALHPIATPRILQQRTGSSSHSCQHLPITLHVFQDPKYYTVQTDGNIEYISATPQPSSEHSLSSPSLSTSDPSSSGKHNESSSSAYNTGESLPSSTYSDGIESLERVLNAACTMYTTHANLEHTIKLQEELFRQRLRLRGIELRDDADGNDDQSSEHFYDNIDSETSDIENEKTSSYRHLSLPGASKKKTTTTTLGQQQRTVTFNTNESEPTKAISQRVKSIDQYYSLGKRKSVKSIAAKTTLAKLISQKKSHSHHSTDSNKKFLSPNMLTVTIT